METQPMQRARTKVGPWTLVMGSVLAMAMTLLTAVMPASGAGAASTSTVITTAQNKTWGKILVLSNGTVVYRLTTDSKNKSACSGECAKIWPPVVLAAGQKTATGKGVVGLGVITRSGGSRQVTYKGVPLYEFIGDHTPGQTTGNIKDTWGRWWVVSPAHPLAVPTAARPTSGVSTPTTVASSGAAY